MFFKVFLFFSILVGRKFCRRSFLSTLVCCFNVTQIFCVLSLVGYSFFTVICLNFTKFDSLLQLFGSFSSFFTFNRTCLSLFCCFRGFFFFNDFLTCLKVFLLIFLFLGYFIIILHYFYVKIF
jgi:hypothetical protein